MDIDAKIAEFERSSSVSEKAEMRTLRKTPFACNALNWIAGINLIGSLFIALYLLTGGTPSSNIIVPRYIEIGGAIALVVEGLVGGSIIVALSEILKLLLRDAKPG